MGSSVPQNPQLQQTVAAVSKDEVARGEGRQWQPPPGRPPGFEPGGADELNHDELREWYRLQSKFPSAYTPYGTKGKHAANAVCALHWPTDHAMVRQRAQRVAAGHTVDEELSHLIIGRAVCSHNGRSVVVAADSLCGPTGITGYQKAHEMGFDVNAVLPPALQLPVRTDASGKPVKLLPVEPAPKPIHSVDGSPLQIYGRINGLKLCINNKHEIEVDLLIGSAAVGCDIILGMPTLAKHSFILNCRTGIAHFQDLNGDLGVFGRGVQRLASLPSPESDRAQSVLAALEAQGRIDVTDAVQAAEQRLRHTDHEAYLRLQLVRTAEYAASRLRRAGEQRRELLHDLDALLMRVITQVGRDGRRTYPGLAKWCVQLGTTDRKKAGSIKTTSRVTEWPMGILSRVPLPPFTETAFWDHTAWLPPERKAFDELRGRFANIATARREAVEYLERAGVCGHCRTDIKQTASAVASVGGRPAGEPTAIKKVSVSNSSSDVKAQQTSRTLPFGASRVGESEEDKPNQFSVHYVALEPSERLSRISGQQPRYNDEDWVTNDGCPHEYRHPGNLKCRLRQGAEEYTFPKPEGASQPVGILNWKRHHRKCTQWNKEKLSPKRPEYVFVNEQYGAGHADGSGYAPQEGDNEGGNLKLGVPKGFNAAAPSETDLAFWRDLQQYNAAEIQSDRLRWADLTEYGGSTKLVSHHNRLTRGNDEDLMLMAVRAFAIWNGTHGPNQPKYCNPQALGNASNRGRRSGGGVGQEYTFSSFKQFLTESQTSTYWSNDHYYRKTHLHLGPGVTEPSLSDHAPPWRDLARKRTAAEAWRLFYDAQTTLGENHALTGARATMIRLDPYPWQAWCPAHANVALTFTRSRVEVTHPSARVLPPPRRRARIPRDMYDKAHLVDGPNVPPSSRDADILRQASAQAVATAAREGGEPSKLDSEPHDDLRPEDDGIRVFAGASPPNGAPLSTAQQAAPDALNPGHSNEDSGGLQRAFACAQGQMSRRSRPRVQQGNCSEPSSPSIFPSLRLGTKSTFIPIRQKTGGPGQRLTDRPLSHSWH